MNANSYQNHGFELSAIIGKYLTRGDLVHLSVNRDEMGVNRLFPLIFITFDACEG